LPRKQDKIVSTVLLEVDLWLVNCIWIEGTYNSLMSCVKLCEACLSAAAFTIGMRLVGTGIQKERYWLLWSMKLLSQGSSCTCLKVALYLPWACAVLFRDGWVSCHPHDQLQGSSERNSWCCPAGTLHFLPSVLLTHQVPSVAFDSLNSLLGAVISPEDDFPSVALMSLIEYEILVTSVSLNVPCSCREN
jgi:hypothetical protein